MESMSFIQLRDLTYLSRTPWYIEVKSRLDALIGSTTR